jgi:hypothetical protein
MGNKAFQANPALFKSKLLSKTANLRPYYSAIKPAVTYACETWVLKECCKAKLLAFERKILRKIYGPFKEIDNTSRIRRNFELYRIIGNRNIVNFIRSQRLKWFGHVCKVNSERLVKAIYE